MISNLTIEMEDEIVEYLTQEINMAEEERAHKKEEWKTWRRQRDAKPEFERKDSPWKNACNVSAPLSAINSQTMYAKLKSTFSVRNPFYSIKPFRDDPGDRRKAEVLEKYFSLICESPLDLNIQSKNKTILQEAGSMGTCYVLVPWDKQTWNFKSKSSNGAIENVEVEIHNGPSLDPLPLEDVLYSESFQDLQRAPWVSYVVHKPWHEIQTLGTTGTYQNVDLIESWGRDHPLDYQEDIDRRRGVSQGNSMVWDLHVCYVFWDVDNDGIVEDLIVTLHKESGTILFIDYNMLGIRPIEPIIYYNRPFYIEGIGTCEMCGDMQEEIDTLHRMRIDNAHISGTRMFAVKRGSGIRGTETIYPGKFLMVDDPGRDIVPIQAGEVYPSSLQAENMAIQYAQRRTGMSDTMGGFADQTLRTRDTSVGQMLRLKEGQGIFSSITEAAADSYSRIGLFIFFQLVLNREIVMNRERKMKRLTDDELSILEECLNMDISELPYRLNFSVRTTDLEQTFESRRQNYLTLAQLYAAYLERVFPVAAQLANPQLPQDLKDYLNRAFIGSSKLMEKIFEFFGEESTEKYIPDYRKSEMILELRQILQGQFSDLSNLKPGGANNVGTNGLPGVGSVPNVGNTEAGNSGANTGNAGMQGLGYSF